MLVNGSIDMQDTPEVQPEATAAGDGAGDGGGDAATAGGAPSQSMPGVASICAGEELSASSIGSSDVIRKYVGAAVSRM
eukprot:1119740-Prymnesium_polylepis.1